MELCLMIEGQEGVSWEQWRALAHTCEGSGIPALFRSDHYMNLDGDFPERGALDAWGTLCALAACTDSLRLGTMVSPASFRHPSVLAKLVTTADHVSGGRVELGLGAGWHEGEHAAYGFPYHRVAERMDVLAEQLEIITGTWSETPFSFSGAHYTLDGLRAEPRPVQQPRPPLIIGGTAGPRSSALAARFADEYNTVFPTLDDVRQRRTNIAEACRAAGRDELPLSIMTAVIVGRDEAEVRDRVGARAARMNADADGLLDDPPAGWIVGTVESAAGQLRALAEAGVSRVMCQHFDHADLEMVTLIGQTLAPLVR
jgi:F420-dependent oxidoreductase-like protein